ncbi:hypothetical protein PBV52_50800 [Streptomyces sp. T12]|uniref:hypothetical protein n=1 Tax=Streptomyces sp. T12 TaxID=477697 RepID=UPI002366BD0C|nr:hypothetical protein [Streptomyces sp. T12]WDF44483.1 hypothetical protein PBV52_50800 [Streptomyces sp. T12]
MGQALSANGKILLIYRTASSRHQQSALSFWPLQRADHVTATRRKRCGPAASASTACYLKFDTHPRPSPVETALSVRLIGTLIDDVSSSGY